MIANEQIGAISSGKHDPDTLRAMFQVIPAPAGTQAIRKGYQGTTTTSITSGHTVRPVNGMSFWKRVMTIIRVIKRSLSETINVELGGNNIIMEFQLFGPETSNILVVNTKLAAGLGKK
jgi:hypothetical protein